MKQQVKKPKATRSSSSLSLRENLLRRKKISKNSLNSSKAEIEPFKHDTKPAKN